MSVSVARKPAKKISSGPVAQDIEGSGGVVRYLVHGATRGRSALDFTASKLIEALRVGLPIQELEDLQSSLGVPMERLCGPFLRC